MDDTYICKDIDPNSLNKIYEYNNIYYENCPFNTKVIEEKRKCVDDCKLDEKYVYEYSNKCYEKCPNNTYYDNDNKYCYNNIPEGFYCSDSENNVLEKCHENCKECNGPPSINNNNCSKCPTENKIFFNLGNCTDNCINGYYNDDNLNKICKCSYNIKCLKCSEKSNELNLCISCNKDQGYYRKIVGIYS
jgi:proprotein convertase subtilisin/kexin type 5